MTKLHRYFFYLTLISLPTQLAKHFWPTWSLVLGRRVDYLSPAVSLTDIFIFLTLIFFIISPVKHHQIPVRKSLFVLAVGMIGGLVALNLLISDHKSVTAIAWIKTLELSSFTAYIIMSRPLYKNVLRILAIPALYSAILALWQYLLQRSVGGIWWYLGERTFDINTPGIARYGICWPDGGCHEVLRSYATFPHPNVLAGFLAVMILVFAADFLKPQTGWSPVKNIPGKYINAMISIISFAALVVTFSRSAILILLLLLSVLFYLSRRKLYGILLFALSVGGMVAIFSGQLNTIDESLVIRTDLNLTSLSMIVKSPVYGYGLGTFLANAPRYISSRTLFYLQPTHNIYLLALNDFGFLGLAAVFLIIFWIFTNTAHLRRFKPDKTYIIAIIFIMIIGLTDHYTYTLQQGQLLAALFFGLILLPT